MTQLAYLPATVAYAAISGNDRDDLARQSCVCDVPPDADNVHQQQMDGRISCSVETIGTGSLDKTL